MSRSRDLAGLNRAAGAAPRMATLSRQSTAWPQLDITITGDSKGGGVAFSMPVGKPRKPARASSSP